MCGSMVDIQSPTAEIRRGKKKNRRTIETTGQKYNVCICYAGRPQQERSALNLSETALFKTALRQRDSMH